VRSICLIMGIEVNKKFKLERSNECNKKRVKALPQHQSCEI
jgi:hypothetical protein